MIASPSTNYTIAEQIIIMQIN